MTPFMPSSCNYRTNRQFEQLFEFLMSFCKYNMDAELDAIAKVSELTKSFNSYENLLNRFVRKDLRGTKGLTNLSGPPKVLEDTLEYFTASSKQK